LTHSYRMDGADPAGRAILEAAQAVRTGRPDRLVAEDVPLEAFASRWFEERIAGGGRWAELAARSYRFQAGAPAGPAGEELAELAALLEGGRVLAVTRRLPGGTIALNDLLHGRAVAALGAPARTGRADLLPG